MKKNMESRRGVALAEVVIALVVITIISVATLSVMFSSVQIENKTIVAMDVRNQAENAIECFRFAKGDETTFIACLNQTEDNNFAPTGENNTYVLDKGGYKTTITVTVDNTDAMTGFEFVATYENNDEEIYRFDFPKSSKEGGTDE